MRYRLRTLLILMADLKRHVVAWLLHRRWLTFSLRGMFALITIFGIWLGYQVNWLRQRQVTRKWIEEHEIGETSRALPNEVTWVNKAGILVHDVADDAPWSLRLLGEKRLNYIELDKAKLSESDLARINSLWCLFPESKDKGIYIQEMRPDGTGGWSHQWPVPDPIPFLRYPTRVVGGKLVNEPPVNAEYLAPSK